MAELWDLYRQNEKGDFVPADIQARRGDPLPEGTFHMVVQAWVQNSKGEYLISRRSAEKSDPLCWEPTGGSAVAGETALQAACREVKEELGVDLDPGIGRHVGCVLRRFKNCDDFVEVWVFSPVDVPIESVVIQKEEVCDVMWASEEKILQLYKEGSWIPWKEYNFLKMIFGETFGE